MTHDEKEQKYAEIKASVLKDLDELNAKLKEKFGEKGTTMIRAQVAAKLMCREFISDLRAIGIPDPLIGLISTRIASIMAHFSAAVEPLFDVDPKAVAEAREQYDEINQRHMDEAGKLDDNTSGIGAGSSDASNDTPTQPAQQAA